MLDSVKGVSGVVCDSQIADSVIVSDTVDMIYDPSWLKLVSDYEHDDRSLRKHPQSRFLERRKLNIKI